MKKKLFMKILKFEQWRLERNKKQLEKELEETNKRLAELFLVIDK